MVPSRRPAWVRTLIAARPIVISVGAIVAAVFLGQIARAVIPPDRAYIPLVHGAPPTHGISHPPHKLICILQTGSATAIDPVTGIRIFACEAKNGHGAIAWTEQGVLLVDSIAGSPSALAPGSVTLTGGALTPVTIASVTTDGGIAWRELSTQDPPMRTP